MNYSVAQAVFIRKLEAISHLSDDERQRAASIVGPLREVQAGEDIVADGSSPTISTLLVQGLACRYKILQDGRRQIMSYQIAGDIVDLYSFVLPKMDHAIGAMTNVIIASVSHDALTDLIEKCPHLTKVLWRDTLVDSAVSREWMVNIGRRTPEQRFAHMISEMHLRMKAVGLADSEGINFPVTQQDLADSFGLSTVHVNRTLRKLRVDGLVKFERGRVISDNWESLAALGGFDPTYLHLNGS